LLQECLRCLRVFITGCLVGFRACDRSLRRIGGVTLRLMKPWRRLASVLWNTAQNMLAESVAPRPILELSRETVPFFQAFVLVEPRRAGAQLQPVFGGQAWVSHSVPLSGFGNPLSTSISTPVVVNKQTNMFVVTCHHKCVRALFASTVTSL